MIALTATLLALAGPTTHATATLPIQPFSRARRHSPTLAFSAISSSDRRGIRSNRKSNLYRCCRSRESNVQARPCRVSLSQSQFPDDWGNDRQSSSSSSSSSNANSNSNSNNDNCGRFDSSDFFLLSMDGALASTCESRSWMAICAALKVWPSLRNDMEVLGIDADYFDIDNLLSTSGDSSTLDSSLELNQSGSRGDEIETMEENDGSSYQWLIQKLSALSSITHQGNDPDIMLGCDAVFLARLLIEEQLLDGGRSNGRGGKYGGKFHPGSSSSGENASSQESNVGSRPLTVGEIFANWSELRHVTRNKYPFIEEEGKTEDPLPVIQKVLNDFFSLASHWSDGTNDLICKRLKQALPSWFPLAYDCLFEYQFDKIGDSLRIRPNTMVLLGHEAQIPWALSSLALLGCSIADIDCEFESESILKQVSLGDSPSNSNDANINVIVTSSEKAWERCMQQQTNPSAPGSPNESNCELNSPLFLVVPENQKDESQSKLIEKIIIDANKAKYASVNTEDSSSNIVQNNFHVVHSSLEVLKQCKYFLGEDAPLLSQGVRKCLLPTMDTSNKPRTAVSLYLPDWADNVHPSQLNDAEMDPWLNVVTEEQLMELMTARIVGSSLVEAGRGK